MDKELTILESIRTLTSGEFGATAIKQELEGQLGRGRTRSGGSGCDSCEGSGRQYCEYCEDGSTTCGTCEGNYDRGEFTCNDCDGDGRVSHFSNGIGSERVETVCEDCDGSGERDYCPDCEQGSYECGDCGGHGSWECEDCDGEEQEDDSPDWGNNTYCHNWLMEKLSLMGLAEYKPDDDEIRLSHGVRTKWHPVAPLVYAEFYTDGSVDSEFTYTLLLNDPRTVLLMPKIIGIWNEMAELIGNGCDVGGAGMHTALLNSPNGLYPMTQHVTHDDSERFYNLKRDMALLMPALFFLGTQNGMSRGLNYRRPGVASDSHRAAIDWRGGAVEFRLFDTCYETPEATLDNIVVMANVMKFWRKNRRGHTLGKTVDKCKWGVSGGSDLKRFYNQREHIDLLNRGLAILKPSYYTITELKYQRAFSTTKTTLKSDEKRRRLEIQTEYKEYEERFNWRKVMNYHHAVQRLASRYADYGELPTDESREEAVARIEREAKQMIDTEYQLVKVEQFVENRWKEIQNASGEYTLTTEGVE